MLKIEILTIGNEILEGRILNTNSKYICEKLYQSGYLVCSGASVLDDAEALTKKWTQSLKDFDVVICSGGLGPTQDDITLSVCAKLFKSSFVVDQKLLQILYKRYSYRFTLEQLEPFATVPKKATLFRDHCGMAPGYLFKKGKKKLILLPGVPYEFEHLVDSEVISYLNKNHPPKQKEFKKIIHLCKVAESQIVPVLDQLMKKYPKVYYGIYPHTGILSIHAKTIGKDSKSTSLLLNRCIKEIEKVYPLRAFDGKYGSIQEAIHHFLIQKKWTISFAESCTGGALSARFTAISDASKYFKGSIVCYHNEIKEKFLEVDPNIIQTEGAVSLECAKQMALGAQKMFNTDLAFAITGIAGPSGGTKEKPVGTVFVAIAHGQKIILSEHLKLTGKRDVIVERTIHNILAEFWINKDSL